MSIISHLKGITNIPESHLKENPPCPPSVKIELTSKCNYKCKFCAYTTRESYIPKDMDWSLFKRITEEMRNEGVREIGLFYIGESFMNPSLLIRAVKYLKKKLKIPYVFLTANASLARYNVVHLLMEHGLDSLKWSCNAADRTQFEEILGAPSQLLDEALKNIKQAHEIRAKYNYKTGLYASSVKYDDDQPALMKPILEHILPYVDEHYWLPLYTAGGMNTQKEKDLSMQPVAGNPGRLDAMVDPIPCWTLFTAAHILVDGRMTACCLDGTGKWVVGDLKRQGFMQTWNSERFKKLRKAHLNKSIKNTLCAECVMA